MCYRFVPLKRCGHFSGCCKAPHKECHASFTTEKIYTLIRYENRNEGRYVNRTFVDHHNCTCKNYCDQYRCPKPFIVSHIAKKYKAIPNMATIESADSIKIANRPRCICTCKPGDKVCQQFQAGDGELSREDWDCVDEGRCLTPVCSPEFVYAHYYLRKCVTRSTFQVIRRLRHDHNN